MSTASARGRVGSRFEADEEVDGGSVVSFAATRSGNSKKSKVTPSKKRTAREVGSDEETLRLGSDAETLGAEECCYLCEQYFKANEEKKKFNGKFFHKKCHAVTRCFRRQLQGLELQDFDGNMLDYPDDFKEKVQPLIKSVSGVRDATALKRAKHYKVTAKTTSKDDVAQKPLLSRPRFYRYHKQWDGWDRAKSNAVFDEKLAGQLGAQYVFCCIQFGNWDTRKSYILYIYIILYIHTYLYYSPSSLKSPGSSRIFCLASAPL